MCLFNCQGKNKKLIYANVYRNTINDGDSQTSPLPIFTEGGGTSVHRLNRITSLNVFHVLLYRLYDRIRRFVSALIAIIAKELKHDENGMSFKSSPKNKPNAHQVSSQVSFEYK